MGWYEIQIKKAQDQVNKPIDLNHPGEVSQRISEMNILLKLLKQSRLNSKV